MNQRGHPEQRRRSRGNGNGRRHGVGKVDVGSRVRDTHANRIGVVLDTARQYAHPQARPVFSYLIRWQDGQVAAISEEAFRRGYGFVLLDER